MVADELTTIRVSVSTSGRQANEYSYPGGISSDGRYVAFSSYASNLVPGDSNNRSDAFVHDQLLGTTTLVSVTRTGVPAGSEDDGEVAVSADGRYVAFQSRSPRIVPGDTNRTDDIFVRDMVTGVTERVSVSTAGVEGNDCSYHPAITPDGRYISFVSCASNLTPRDFNNAVDVFVHDRQTEITERASVGSGPSPRGHGTSWNAGISADGRYVAFVGSAKNLVPERTDGSNQVFVRDRSLGRTQLVSLTAAGAQIPGGVSGPAEISADGRHVTFPADEEGIVPEDRDYLSDIFVRDLESGTTELVSVTNTGRQTARGSFSPDISGDGRWIVFRSNASKLVAGDTNGHSDIFVRDTVAHTTSRTSLSTSGVQADSFSYAPYVSADGRFVAFLSYAANLVPGDTNEATDVFVRYLGGL